MPPAEHISAQLTLNVMTHTLDIGIICVAFRRSSRLLVSQQRSNLERMFGLVWYVCFYVFGFLRRA